MSVEQVNFICCPLVRRHTHCEAFASSCASNNRGDASTNCVPPTLVLQNTAICHTCDEMIAPEDRICGQCQGARSAKVNDRVQLSTSGVTRRGSPSGVFVCMAESNKLKGGGGGGMVVLRRSWKGRNGLTEWKAKMCANTSIEQRNERSCWARTSNVAETVHRYAVDL